ncbi:hypothetical protein Gotur_031691 [Gossypium turneri]
MEGKRAKIGRESQLSNRGLYPDELGVDTKTKKSDLFLSAKGLTRKSNKKIFHLFNRTCNRKDLD